MQTCNKQTVHGFIRVDWRCSDAIRSKLLTTKKQPIHHCWHSKTASVFSDIIIFKQMPFYPSLRNTQKIHQKFSFQGPAVSTGGFKNTHMRVDKVYEWKVTWTMDALPAFERQRGGLDGVTLFPFDWEKAFRCELLSRLSTQALQEGRAGSSSAYCLAKVAMQPGVLKQQTHGAVPCTRRCVALEKHSALWGRSVYSGVKKCLPPLSSCFMHVCHS